MDSQQTEQELGQKSDHDLLVIVVSNDIVLIFSISLTWWSPMTSYTLGAVDANDETRRIMDALVPQCRSERSCATARGVALNVDDRFSSVVRASQ